MRTASAHAMAIVKATAPALEKHGLAITTAMYARLFENKDIEAMFDRAAQTSGEQPKRLAAAIRETLVDAIEHGGSTLRDFVSSEGEAGCYQHQSFVYGREGGPCRVCGSPVRALRQQQRSTFYCPHCQR